MTRRWRLAWGVVLLGAATARAQIEFQDDFESGPYPADGGGLGWSMHQTTLTTLTVNNLAAHRGKNGLRVTDNDPSSSNSSWSWLQYDLPADAGALSSYYLRAWVRFTGTQVGDGIVLRMQTPGPEYCQVRNALLVPKYYAEARAVSFSYSSGALVTGSEGPWQLVELGVEGFNTPDAGFSLWIDGGYAAGVPLAVDFTGVQPTQVLFGEALASDSSFTGTIDLDDVRASTSAPASRLSIVGPSSVLAGACNTFALALTSSKGGATGAPYAFPATVTAVDAVTGAQLDAGVFSDTTCTISSGAVVFSPGQLQAQFGVRLNQSGSVLLNPTYVDFLSKDAIVAVIGVSSGDGGRTDAGSSASDAGPPGGPDGGTPDGSTPDSGAVLPLSGATANLGCGSSNAAPGLLALLALALLFKNRRGDPGCR